MHPRTGTKARALAAGILCATAAAVAATGSQLALPAAMLVSDDFESGTLLPTDNPPGQWTSSFTSSRGVVQIEEGSEHRGLLGMCVDDTASTDRDGGSSSDPVAAISIRTDSLTSELRGRAWVRIVDAFGSSYINLIHVMSEGQVPSGTPALLWGGLLEINANIDATASTATIELAGSDTFDSYDSVALPNPINLGQWYLFDFGLKGMGTSGGSRSLMLDNDPSQAAEVFVDLSGLKAGEVFFGEPWGAANWTGRIDMDDARVGPKPLASHLHSFIADRTYAVGECEPYQVKLWDSISDVESEAPYTTNVTVELSWSDVGAFYGNAACTGAPVTSVKVPAGTSAATLWFRAEGWGSAQVMASHPEQDFFGYWEHDLHVAPSTPPDHVEATTAAPQVDACAAATIGVSVVDDTGKTVPGMSWVELCAQQGIRPTFVSTNLSAAEWDGERGCLYGRTPISGQGTAVFSSSTPAAITFVPGLSGELPASPVSVTQTWRAGGASPTQSALAFTAGGQQATIATHDGAATGVLTPRDACGNAVNGVSASRVKVVVPSGLTAGEPVAQGDGTITFDLSVGELCPATGSTPLDVKVLLDGSELLDGAGAPVRLRVAPKCRAPDLGFIDSLHADCGEAYSYPPEGQPPPGLSGDGPFTFAIEPGPDSVPEGITVDDQAALHWTPTRAQTGTYHLKVVASGPGGTTRVPFTLEVRCTQDEYRVGCSAAGGGGSGVTMLSGLLLALGGLLWRRRRTG